MIQIEFQAGMLQIRSIGFFGHFTSSRAGNLILGWGRIFQTASGRVVMLRAGQQISWRIVPRLGRLTADTSGQTVPLSSDIEAGQPNNRVVRICEGELLWQAEIERPRDGSVADTGHAVISDWGSPGGCKGGFYVFAPDGTVLINQKMRANMGITGIADDGTLAWCTTIYSSQQKYDDRLIVFSLSPPKAILNAANPASQSKIIHVQKVDKTIEVSTIGERYLYDVSGRL
ncbi:MAG: hypothetical protein HYX72_12835 [Acidobacteria bacterium]|nr:hypothetical protein [Acidobacteriota bacterium]